MFFMDTIKQNRYSHPISIQSNDDLHNTDYLL